MTEWESDDPLRRALAALPRPDLAPDVQQRQRVRLHAELARVTGGALCANTFAQRLESWLLGVCGACVVVRLALALLLFMRAGM